MFYIGTPLDTRMFNNDIIYILISESTQEAEVYMNKNQFLGKRNFTDFVYGYCKKNILRISTIIIGVIGGALVTQMEIY